LAVCAVLASTFGCLTVQESTRVPFTEELIQQYGLSNDDLKNLQYYTSSDITLQHELTSGRSEVTSGHILKSQQGKLIEEIDIVSGTLGVAFYVQANKLGVGFEKNGNYLNFTSRNTGGILEAITN